MNLIFESLLFTLEQPTSARDFSRLYQNGKAKSQDPAMARSDLLTWQGLCPSDGNLSVKKRRHITCVVQKKKSNDTIKP